jgi:hypothetical protein
VVVILEFCGEDDGGGHFFFFVAAAAVGGGGGRGAAVGEVAKRKFWGSAGQEFAWYKGSGGGLVRALLATRLCRPPDACDDDDDVQNAISSAQIWAPQKRKKRCRIARNMCVQVKKLQLRPNKSSSSQSSTMFCLPKEVKKKRV